MRSGKTPHRQQQHRQAGQRDEQKGVLPGEPFGNQNTHDRPHHRRQRVHGAQDAMKFPPVLGRKKIGDGHVTAGHYRAAAQTLYCAKADDLIH